MIDAVKDADAELPVELVGDGVRVPVFEGVLGDCEGVVVAETAALGNEGVCVGVKLADAAVMDADALLAELVGVADTAPGVCEGVNDADALTAPGD